MEGSAAAHPPQSDGAGSSRSAWNRPRGGGFEWIAPAPSPVVIAELEDFYPDIIQVPIEALEVEEDRWGSHAILARCLSRWIPPEIIIREFHRAGLPGKIDALALAEKHYIFHFSDLQAKSLALERPWVVFGQPIITADWVPEFVPSNSSLCFALLWIRLPQLPIKFWHEDVLSSVLSVAGEFLFADAATMERKRGSFARACVRVDLSKPLRPGARIRGSRAPFWQQFSYENLDGICASCGSLHVSGNCLAGQNSSSSTPGPGFGPWMAAIRRRKAPQGLGDLNRGPGSSPAQSDGWQLPRKVARRQSARGTPSIPLSMETKTQSNIDLGSSRSLDGFLNEAGPLNASLMNAENNSEPGSLIKSVPADTVHKFQSETYEANPNPFASLSSDSGLIPTKPRVEGSSGLLKRTRPSEPSVHRVVSKPSKAKGKAPLGGKSHSPGSFAFQASADPAQGSHDLAGTGKRKSRRKNGSSHRSESGTSLPVLVEGADHESAVLLLKKAIIQGELSAGTVSTCVEIPSPLVEVPIAQGLPFSEDCRGMGPVVVTLPAVDHVCAESMGDPVGVPPTHIPE